MKKIAMLFLFIATISAQQLKVPSAYSTIQSAIDAASAGDTVLVAAGTYTENISFSGKNIVVGSLYLTTQDTSYISSTVISGAAAGYIISMGAGNLVGLSIKGGFSDIQEADGLNIGANFSGRAILNHVRITGCRVYGGYGVAMRASGDSLIINNSSFIDNKDNFNTDGLLAITDQLNYFEINNSVFDNNHSTTGSALRLQNNNAVINNTIIKNSSSSSTDGGVLWIQGAAVTITNSVILNNSGGITLNQTDGNSLTILNNTFHGNNYGIAFYNSKSTGEKPLTIIKNSIFSNHDNDIKGYSTDPMFTSLWQNKIYVYNSLINLAETWVTLAVESGNIDDNPLFCDYAGNVYPNLKGNYHLMPSSPAVGTGENGVNMGALGVGCEIDRLETLSDFVPNNYFLHENYPNPFNPTTTLRFDLPEVSDITLTIYNMLGQIVRTFNMNDTHAGYHVIKWDATNDYGDPVGAGVYLYQLRANEFVKTKKMVLLK